MGRMGSKGAHKGRPYTRGMTPLLLIPRIGDTCLFCGRDRLRYAVCAVAQGPR